MIGTLNTDMGGDTGTVATLALALLSLLEGVTTGAMGTWCISLGQLVNGLYLDARDD